MVDYVMWRISALMPLSCILEAHFEPHLKLFVSSYLTLHINDSGCLKNCHMNVHFFWAALCSSPTRGEISFVMYPTIPIFSPPTSRTTEGWSNPWNSGSPVVFTLLASTGKSTCLWTYFRRWFQKSLISIAWNGSHIRWRIPFIHIL